MLALPHRRDKDLRSADGSRCLEFLRPHSGTASSHDDGVVNRVCVHSFAFEIEVVLGGETSMCMSTASLESTVREGFDASCLCLVERSMIVRSTGVGETGSPPPSPTASSS